jgi:hypothetical protein
MRHDYPENRINGAAVAAALTVFLTGTAGVLALIGWAVTR